MLRLRRKVRFVSSMRGAKSLNLSAQSRRLSQGQHENSASDHVCQRAEVATHVPSNTAFHALFPHACACTLLSTLAQAYAANTVSQTGGNGYLLKMAAVQATWCGFVMLLGCRLQRHCMVGARVCSCVLTSYAYVACGQDNFA